MGPRNRKMRTAGGIKTDDIVEISSMGIGQGHLDWDIWVTLGFYVLIIGIVLVGIGRAVYEKWRR